jgi:D-alanyl-D-alanine carboxypeptidase
MNPAPLARHGFSFILALLVGSGLPARAFGHHSAVDAVVERYMATHHVPSVSVAVVRSGRPLVKRGYGFANLECGLPASSHTLYQIGSITKPFTATAIMMLISEGKLSLDERVASILDGLPPSWNSIRVKDLMSHTSGIGNYPTPQMVENPRRDFTRHEILDLIAAQPIEFPAGDEWKYSNSGYFLLGLVVEKVAGQDYESFLKQRLFMPLGMTATRLSDMHDIIPGRAQGYIWNGGRLQIAEYLSPTQPWSAGGLLSTIDDLVKWDAALSGMPLKNQAELRQMWTSGTLNNGQATGYGFGWVVDHFAQMQRVAHGGAIQGFSSYFERLGNGNLTVVVLMNRENGGAEELANAIVKVYLPDAEARGQSIGY